jgi:hypothetical protein
MTRLIDAMRALIISPEAVVLALSWAAYLYWPSPFVFLSGLIGADLKSCIEVLAFPSSITGAAYTLSTDVISPQGSRSRLLDWPEYWMLKHRVVLALFFCAVTVPMTAVGWYMIAQYHSASGAALILAAYSTGCVTTISLGLARWRSRELFRE